MVKHHHSRIEHRRTVDVIFLVVALVILCYTVYSVITDMTLLKDCIFALAAIGVFYLIQRNYHLPFTIVIIGFIPIMFHLSGLIFGLYDLFLLGVGYDKIIHFTNAACGAVFIFYLLNSRSRDMPINKALAAMLIVLGIGAIVENIEFVGGKYFDMHGPTIFSEDGLSVSTQNAILQKLALSPQVQRDMIINDTAWDMLFNLMGVIVGSMIIAILWRIDKKNLKHKVNR